MTTENIIIIITILLYLAAVIAVGFKYSGENRNTGDFYLGGRKLGPFVTAMSAEASDMSSWLLMGLPGVAYISGCAEAVWTAVGLALGTYINWLVVAKRIRVYSQKAGNAITIPDFFSNRYRDKSNALKCIAALVIIIFFIPYTASGFSACGKLFSSLFGVNYLPAMIISAVVIVLYTTLGGFLAASTTDFIQSIVMTIAIAVVLGFGLVSAGGFSNVIDNAAKLPGYLDLRNIYDITTNTSKPYSIITIVSLMAWGLGYFGMPHILLRFMAIEDKNKLTLSRRIATVWVVFSMAIAVFIGIIGYSLSQAEVIGSYETASQAETIIVNIAKVISSYGWFAAIIGGIILAGILAATMSTADSQLLAASSSVSENLIEGLFKIKVSTKTSMWIARISVMLIALIAMFIASDPNSSVFGIVSFAWAGFGAAFGPVMLFALFWKRSNRWGALAGMISGGATVFIWKYMVRPIGGVWDIYELLPAFIVASIFIVAVSLITPAPSKEIMKEFDEVNAGK